jgi:hypothetical protein
MTLDAEQHVPAPDEVAKTLSRQADVQPTDPTPRQIRP